MRSRRFTEPLHAFHRQVSPSACRDMAIVHCSNDGTLLQPALPRCVRACKC